MADVSELAALIVAVAAATTVVWKMIRGLWRLARNVEDTLESANETKHLVKYHLGPNGTTRPMTFDERATLQRRISRTCTVCTFLAELPDGYRDEVLDALAGFTLPTTDIMHQVAEDGYGHDLTRFTWEKHRRGDCSPVIRAQLLGKRDGVRGKSR